VPQSREKVRANILIVCAELHTRRQHNKASQNANSAPLQPARFSAGAIVAERNRRWIESSRFPLFPTRDKLHGSPSPSRFVSKARMKKDE
jgi:hypothetical protein